MIKKPLYSFNHIDDIGINRVPTDNLVLVEDDGFGNSRLFFLKSNLGVGPTTTVRYVLDSLPANWYDIASAGGSNSANVEYDNTASELVADNVQDAIDELDDSMDRAVEDQLVNITNIEAQTDIDTILGT